MTVLGHNKPPTWLGLSDDTIAHISHFMAEHPVVENEDAARAMKKFIDLAKLGIKDLEAERDTKVRPLNNQVDAINSEYRKPRRMLGSLLDEMLARNELFVKAEEKRREQLAAEAMARAKQLEQIALEAERIERERLDDAAKGEVGIDVAEAISDADEAFDDYQRAERAAILAQKETHVKVGGGFGRAIGLREKETLSVTDLPAAIVAMGMTPDIEEAVLKSARAWRKVHGKLPTGVTSTVEKHL